MAKILFFMTLIGLQCMFTTFNNPSGGQDIKEVEQVDNVLEGTNPCEGYEEIFNTINNTDVPIVHLLNQDDSPMAKKFLHLFPNSDVYAQMDHFVPFQITPGIS